MYKKFKRLLGLLMVFAMLVGLVPLNGMTQVNAAITGTVYFDNAQTGWHKVYLNTGSDFHEMTLDSATGYYKYDVNGYRDDTKIIFTNSDSWNNIKSADYNRTIQTDLKVNVVYQTTSNGGTIDNKMVYGLSTARSNGGGDTQGTFPVKTRLVDYYNDARVGQEDTGDILTWNQGNATGDKNMPYSRLNQWLSSLSGYADNGVTDNQNSNAPVPLYFGDLLHESQGGGNLTWYWQGANVAFGPNDDTAHKDVAQGIVGDYLIDGNLVTSYTDESGNAVKVPFFNENVYEGQSQYMKFYNNLEFPFQATTVNGVTNYSFDSKQNNVYYDYNNRRIVESDAKITDVQGESGYFPFNSTDPGSDDWKLNYGFGTEFTIPFTIDPSGVDKNGKDVVFNFTGDDDVWVYIDGALVLDMGGAHELAEGMINFRSQTVTINTGTSDARIGNQEKAGNRAAAVDNGKSTISFKNITVKLSDGTTTDLATHMAKKGEVHELKMYYMERGMWNSNMSINFNFVPVPSGLTLSKTLDTANVNEGLQDAVEGYDDFEFKFETKNLKETSSEYAPVTDLGYTMYDYNNNSYPNQQAENSKLSISSQEYAGSFVKYSDKSDIFYGGTGFRITETDPNNAGATLKYDTEKTTWSVYDSISASAPEIQGQGFEAVFNMGDENSSDFDSYTKYVNFKNVLKVNDVNVQKKWNGDVPESLNDTEFKFKIEVSLDGTETGYTSYSLAYTDGNGTDKTTDENGNFTIKANETVVFGGIPVGAKVRITETETSGPSWAVDGSASTEVIVDETSGGVNASITNKTASTTLNKVIYVEAGSDPTAYAPEDVTITKATLTSGQADGAKVEEDPATKGKLNVTAPTADVEYVYTIEGTTSDGKTLDSNSSLTVYTYKATDKVYVFDYGLESNIAETNENGDGLFEGGVFYNKEAESTNDCKTTAALGTDAIADDGETPQTDISADEGGVKINKDGSSIGKVTFEPQAFMDQAEKYTYTADITKNGATLDKENPETGTVVNGTIKVMPANVVYYEDNFNSDAETGNSSVKIIYSGNNNKTEGDPIDLTQSNDQSEEYGHDDAYTSGTTDSGGSSTALTADGYNTKAEFTFKGSGFDVVARTTTETAGIMYTIQKYNENTGKWSFVKVGAVDTYYANGDLYQIPVIHEEFGEIAKYKVTLGIKATGSGSVVYLDGIRIYNPMGTSGEKDYIDNEESAAFTKVSDLILGDGEITETGIVNGDGSEIKGQTISGSKAALLKNSFKEGKLWALGYTKTEDSNGDAIGSNQTNSLLQYMHSGPNNEIYLDENASIAFVAEVQTGDSSTIQVEAKLVNIDGQSKEVPTSAGVALNVWNGTGLVQVDTVRSATAMYYTIDLNDCIKLGDNRYLVVISGNSDAESGGTSSLSFSNLKYNGYTLSNPLDKEYAGDMGKYINTSNLPGGSKFVDFTGSYTIIKGQWVNWHYKVTLSEDVFNGGDPEFTMYYTNNGKKTEVTVTAKRVEGADNKYLLRFRAPNAVGTFPIEIHYVTDGNESDEYLTSSMKVNR